MAKKKRTAKRSAKAGKRRPTTKRKSSRKDTGAEAKGEVGTFVPEVSIPLTGVETETKLSSTTNLAAMPEMAVFGDSFDVAAQQIATGREPSAALQSTQAVTEPPPAVVKTAALEGRIDLSVRADAIIIPAPVPITPTVYPDIPQGMVIVQNHVTINIQKESSAVLIKTLKR